MVVVHHWAFPVLRAYFKLVLTDTVFWPSAEVNYKLLADWSTAKCEAPSRGADVTSTTCAEAATAIAQPMMVE